MSNQLDKAALRFAPLWERSYDPGVGRSFHTPERTVKECMARRLEGRRDDAFIQYSDEAITRWQADKIACRLGNGLTGCGIMPQDCVSIIVSNRPEIVYAFMACYKAGFVAAAFNQRSTAYEIEANLASAASRALIIEREHLGKVLGAVRSGSLPALRLVVVIDGFESAYVDDCLMAEGHVVQFVSFEQLVKTSSEEEPAYQVRPQDYAIQLFTGGTTGVSKGIRQTHEALVFEIQDMFHWAGGALKGADATVLVCMPMTHVMGINYGIHWQLINGGNVVITSRTQAHQIIEDMNRYRPNMWGALPALLYSLVHEQELEKTAFSQLDLVVFGGSFIPSDVVESLMAKTKAAIVNSYGMSESFGFVSCNPVGSVREGSKADKAASIGLPISSTDMLIVDPATGLKALEPNNCGEIIFRGPQCARSYWNNPAETAIAIRDGWIYSGDIGYMDDDGYFYIVDRKKDMICVGGFNVFPSEVDNILASYPGVREACTIGVADERSGERAKSFVVMREGCSATEEELRAYCKRYLVAYKAPRYVEFLPEIPKTKAHKPDRAALRRLG